MSAASPRPVMVARESSLTTKVAAIAVLVALAALAAYAMFSGPTKAPTPAGGPSQAVPGKAAPAGEEQSPERRGGRGD